MAPRNVLPTLCETCEVSVANIIYHAARTRSTLQPTRAYILDAVPLRIRSKIISLLGRHLAGSPVLFALIDVLVDEYTRKLNLDGPFLFTIFEWQKLMMTLISCKPTRLEEMVFKVKVDPLKELPLLPLINSVCEVLFSMTKHLQVIVLQGVANDSMLALLGKNCALRYVDVSESCLVTDDGIRSFCKGNVANVEQVRLQNTNVSSDGVATLLKCLPKLKSVGNFINYSTLGDVLIRSGAKLCDIVELWDTSLTSEKACKIAKIAPKLSHLYTSGERVIHAEPFVHLMEIVVDFDFHDWVDDLEQFLTVRGSTIERLEICDQNHPLNLSSIISLCPNLKTLVAKITSDHHDMTWQQLSDCRLTLANASSFVTFFSCVPAIENAEFVISSTDTRPTQLLMDHHLDQVMLWNQLNMLTSLSLKSPVALGKEMLYKLLQYCPKLRRLGCLQNWQRLCRDDLSSYVQQMRSENNWDVTLEWGGMSFPSSKYFT